MCRVPTGCQLELNVCTYLSSLLEFFRLKLKCFRQTSIKCFSKIPIFRALCPMKYSMGFSVTFLQLFVIAIYLIAVSAYIYRIVENKLRD